MQNPVTRRAWLVGAAAARAAAQSAAPLRLPRKLRIGLIGLEGHTGEILRPLRSHPDLELVAASDPREKALASFARGPHAAARRYADYRELLDREKLDLVGICGDNGSRAAIIVAAAERKLHIAAEKPLAITRPDLERIKKAVAGNDVRLTMLLPMRFSPPYLAMQQIVASGQIGEVAQMGAQKSYKLGERPDWMRRRSSFGGTIPYIGVHMVDLMRFTSGREMVETVAFQSRIGYPDLQEMENTTATLFRLDNGGTAALRMDYLRPQTAPSHGDDRLRLAGTEGVLEYQGGALSLITGKEKPRTVTQLPPPGSLFLNFLDFVYNSQANGLPLQDIYRVNEIVLAARESADQGRIVKT
jgi:predicted dehydrogenase